MAYPKYLLCLNLAGEFGAVGLRCHRTNVAHHVYQRNDGDDYGYLHLGNLLERESCTHFCKKANGPCLPLTYIPIQSLLSFFPFYKNEIQSTQIQASYPQSLHLCVTSASQGGVLIRYYVNSQTNHIAFIKWLSCVAAHTLYKRYSLCSCRSKRHNMYCVRKSLPSNALCEKGI